MKVRQHIPAFFSGYERHETEVNSLEELQALDFVRRWTTLPGFYRFSFCGDYGPRRLLMAELNEGKKWYVVAYLSGDTLPVMDLPEWAGPIK